MRHVRRMGRRSALPLAALGVALLAACGGASSSGTSGTSGPLTAPSPPSAQPPLVNICCAIWVGQASYAGAGSGLWRFAGPAQSGAQVSLGAGGLGFFDHAGPFDGTISGDTMTFNFSYGMAGQGCGNALSGTATIGLRTITGTFSGHDCAGQAVNGGTFTATIQDFPGVPSLRTQAFPIGGTWVNSTGTSGGGTWTFQLSEQVTDFSSSVLAGSVTVSGSDRLHLGSGTVTGSVANTFPGPTSIVTLNVSFTGGCPSTIQLTDQIVLDGAGLAPSPGQPGATGSMCDGSTPIPFVLQKR